MMEYSTGRNRDFLAAVNNLLNSPTGCRLTLRQAVEQAAASPAPHYYVTFDHAVKCLNRLGRGLTPGAKTSRRMMWIELRLKVQHLCDTFGYTRHNAIAHVLRESRASSFFLTPSSAWSLYHAIMSGRVKS